MSQHFPFKNSADMWIGALKLLVSILLGIAVYSVASIQANKSEKAASQRAQAAASSAPATKPGKSISQAQAAASSPSHEIPGSVENFEKAIQGMKETSDLLVSWAIVLFGGTIGIAVLAQGAKIRDGRWGLIFISPTWVLLYFSLVHGSQFKAGLTYQIAHGAYVFSELNLNLFLQQKFFEYSLIALAALAVWYLFFRFSLLEQKTDGGD